MGSARRSVLIGPGDFHDDSSETGVAGLGDGAMNGTFAGGVLTRHRTAVVANPVDCFRTMPVGGPPWFGEKR
jgi:hypothetical protein